MAEKMDSIKVVDGRLIVDVALTGGERSASGKSKVYFSTRGNKALNDDFVVGINLYKKE